jgi:hypothetical protein
VRCLDGVSTLKVIVWNRCILQNTGCVCVLIPGSFDVFSFFGFERASMINQCLRGSLRFNREALQSQSNAYFSRAGARGGCGGHDRRTGAWSQPTPCTSVLLGRTGKDFHDGAVVPFERSKAVPALSFRFIVAVQSVRYSGSCPAVCLSACKEIKWLQVTIEYVFSSQLICPWCTRHARETKTRSKGG